MIRDNKDFAQGRRYANRAGPHCIDAGRILPAQPEHYSAVSDAAMAIYAYKSWPQRDLSGAVDTGRMAEAIKEASGGALTLGRSAAAVACRLLATGMDEAGFRELLERGDYRKAQGMNAEDIKKHGIFESIGDGRYLVRIGPGYVQSERAPFILDLGSIPPRA